MEAMTAEARVTPQLQWIFHHRHHPKEGATLKAFAKNPGQGSKQTRLRLTCKAIRAVNGKENFPFSERGQYKETPGDGSLFMRKETRLSKSDLSREVDDGKAQPVYEHTGNRGEDPYRILEYGRKVYLDELDVLTLLNPSSYLIPTDSRNYNQAAYLWKKIGDIPEERRHRLLDLLTPRQVANMWDISGQIYGHPNPPTVEPASILLGSQSEFFMKPVLWTGKTFNVSGPLSWINRFQKAFFLAADGSIYGRLVAGGWLLKGMTEWLLPLFFEARETRKVVATEEPCNIVLEYGDGQVHLQELPSGFPKPAKHPWPFNDASFDYLRPAGPGVLVGQWWIEGTNLEQVPKKFLDVVLIREYGH